MPALQNQGKNNVDNQINSQASGGGWTLATGINISYSQYNCNPGILQATQQTAFYASVDVTGSAIGYHPSDAQNACQVIAPSLPNGFNTWMQPQSGYSLSGITGVNGTTVSFNCSYNWTALYQVDQASLASQLANLPVSTAQSTCNSVTRSTCTIDAGGNQDMPSAAGNIHIVENP